MQTIVQIFKRNLHLQICRYYLKIKSSAFKSPKLSNYSLPLNILIWGETHQLINQNQKASSFLLQRKIVNIEGYKLHAKRSNDRKMNDWLPNEKRKCVKQREQIKTINLNDTFPVKSAELKQCKCPNCERGKRQEISGDWEWHTKEEWTDEEE